MTNTNRINVQILLETAKNSEHKESFIVLKKTQHYRIGVGVRLELPNHFSFFLEILIYLCTENSQVDLPLLETKLAFLNKLHEREYVLSCQNDSSIFGEITVPAENLDLEYEIIESLGQDLFLPETPPTME